MYISVAIIIQFNFKFKTPHSTIKLLLCIELNGSRNYLNLFMT